MISGRSLLVGILKRLGSWWLLLTALAITSLYLSSDGLGTIRAPWGAADALVTRLSLVFPFVAFAGGLAGATRRAGVRRSVAAVLLVTALAAALAYVGGEVLGPVARYRQALATGDDVSATFPFGPYTPRTLVRLRAAVLAAPPEAYGFSVDGPLSLPPNWITYLIHAPVAMALFAIPNALLGFILGWMTSDVGPPSRRRHVRWAAGLASGVTFFVAAFVGTQWVRASPDHSALMGAWAPLLLPAIECLFLAVVLTRRSRLHEPPDTSV